MAEGLFRALLAQNKLSGWEVGSAGTWTQDGTPATPQAVQALAARGIDIRTHRSRQVSARLLEQAGLVLVMTRAHAEALRAEFPQARNRVRLLSSLAGASYDIPDPIGKPLSEYEATAGEIARLIERGLPAILEALQPPAGG